MKTNKQRLIYGIGVDICEVSRVRTKLERHGDKFAKKVLTTGEYSVYSNIETLDKQARFVAKCWSVKEAFVKAIGTGFARNFFWGDIGYLSSDGRPTVLLSDNSRYDIRMRNKFVHLSVSDEKHNAIAFITIEEER